MTDFNVAKLAKDLGLEAHIVRTKLRAAKIEKNEGKYEWTKERDYLAVLKQLKTGAKAETKEVVKDSGKSKGKTKDAGGAPENKKAKAKKKAAAED